MTAVANPIIRLFSPADQTIEPPAPPPKAVPPPATQPARSIFEAFELLVLPELHDRSPDTVQEYRLHLRRFGEFNAARLLEDGQLCLSAGKDRILHPVLPDIDKPFLLRFRHWLQQQTTKAGKPSLSNRSINKHLGSVLTILRACSDEGWVDRVPRLRRLTEASGGNKHYLTYDQVSALYDACSVAHWPNRLGYPAPVYWRAAVVLWFNYGLRTQELIRYEGRMRCLFWRNIIPTEKTPAPDGHASNPLGWLSYVPKKQERFKPEPLVLGLNDTVYAHLKSIAPPGGCNPDEPVFPFPLSSDSFATTWNAICLAAGFRPAELEKCRIKHLRKTCETWHDRHFRWKIGEFVTGHAERTVSEKHYSHLEMDLLDAIHGLPQPEAFTESLVCDLSTKRPTLVASVVPVVQTRQLNLF